MATPMMAGQLPAVLTIAGSDSSGGAGIQADLKTFTALGVYGASVLTALTAQNTRGVTAVHTPPAEFVVAQIAAVFDDLRIAAVKTGMLANAGIVAAVATALAGHPSVPVVVDPVMVATSGDSLLEPDAVAAVRTKLIPCATLITPNLPEAAALLGAKIADTLAEAEAQARALLSLGSKAVLVKGGHRQGVEAIDILATADGRIEHIGAPWIVTQNTHGTGCTLSAAIAALLARDEAAASDGAALLNAVRGAKSYLTSALEAGADMKIGRGHGPVDHLFEIRRRPPL
jgi:hydroxymethylpyrimidine/phosphomethylpyrimidine kinase